jgi:cytochrome c-type biogenesis protein CcmE
MFHWLIANKEWLFSGIGVAVLLAVTTWVTSRRRKAGVGTSSAMVAATGPERADILSTLTPDEVCAAADDSTLTTFQRSVRHDKYSGQRVRWTGGVQDVVADKTSREITLWFHPFTSDGSRAGFVCANLDRKVADALLVIRKGDTVTVEGTVQMPRTFGSVSLEKPVLIDHSAAPIEPRGSSKSAASSKDPPLDPSIGVADVFGVIEDRARTVLNVQADAHRFEGRRVRWGGLVLGVSQVTKAAYQLVFGFAVKDGKMWEVPAELSEVDEGLMRAMSPGDQVEVMGTISLMGRFCRLRQAQILGHSKATTSETQAGVDRAASTALETRVPDSANR